MSKVKILDYTALVNLRASLKEFSESFDDPLAAIEQDLQEILQMMQKKLEVLQKDMERAQEQLSRAEAALSRCESSQRWDEEDHCYHPSCDWERGAERAARARFEDARRRFEAAERIYKEVDNEVAQYLKPFGVIQIGGAADYLRKEMSRLKDADDKMGKILDLVERYLGSKTSPDGQEKTPSEVREKLIQEAEDKKGKFRIATREVSARIDEQEEEDVYGVDIKDEDNRIGAIHEFDQNKCPYCGRPKKICVCGRGPRELERY